MRLLSISELACRLEVGEGERGTQLRLEVLALCEGRLRRAARRRSVGIAALGVEVHDVCAAALEQLPQPRGAESISLRRERAQCHLELVHAVADPLAVPLETALEAPPLFGRVEPKKSSSTTWFWS